LESHFLKGKKRVERDRFAGFRHWERKKERKLRQNLWIRKLLINFAPECLKRVTAFSGKRGGTVRTHNLQIKKSNRNEKDFSTLQPSQSQQAWIPRENGNQGRPQGIVPPSRQGPRIAQRKRPSRKQVTPYERKTA
jgi:hypothetical protein